jgi:transposase
VEQEKLLVQEQRKQFKKELESIELSRLIFIDESGVHCGMSRLYGRAQGKKRVKGFSRFHPGQRTTLIGALGCQGFKACLFGSWYTDGSIFLTFIQQNLAPSLSLGDIVVMDNLSAHKVKGVKESIEATGARLLYLPPYSPDLSPIELAWSKIKNTLRKSSTLTHSKLYRAICKAFRSVTINDSLAWFKHCGYNINTF